MEALSLYARMVLAVLFATTFYAKVTKLEEHAAIVKEYRILPERMAGWFARAEVYVELVLAVLLFFGALVPMASLGAAMLLAAYSIAIALNLLRGRTEVSCGCGGAAGNHALSWWLVARNLVLIGLAVWVLAVGGEIGSLQALLQGAAWQDVFGFGYWAVSAIGWMTVVLMTLANELQGIRRKIRELMQHDSVHA